MEGGFEYIYHASHYVETGQEFSRVSTHTEAVHTRSHGNSETARGKLIAMNNSIRRSSFLLLLGTSRDRE